MGVSETRLLTMGMPYFSSISSATRDQAAGALDDLGVDALGGPARVALGAVVERDAHGDGAHVEVLGPDHADGLEDLLLGDEDHGRLLETAERR